MNNDLLNIRNDFEILKKNIIYLDSAATSLTPKQVIKKINLYYNEYNANVHRSMYSLGKDATEIFENTRKKIAEFINAQPEEIIFTKGTTESINILANSIKLSKNENIVLTKMEHHSNIVPWQILSDKKKSEIRYLDVKNFQIDLDSLKEIDNKTRIVSFAYVSNVLGTILPVKEIIKIAKKNKTLTHIDAAQAVPHLKIDVKELDCDFLSFSGHKILGPTGIGILYGKKKHLKKLKPLLYGGNMISEVDLNFNSLNEIPFKFEAGTPNIAGVFGLGAAIEYINKIGFEKINEHEKILTEKMIKGLKDLNATIYGFNEYKNRIGVVSFDLKNINFNDVAFYLNEKNIAIRTGFHCTMPLMKHLKIEGCCRASIYLYNTEEDINILLKNLKEIKKLFGDIN
jgi:cysteine desulfurase / selenocysteine lyase